MAEREEFLLEIEIPPRTLPMTRLAEYVRDLASLPGQEEHVHLIEIRESTTVLVPVVDDIAFQKVQKQVLAIRNRSAPQKAMKAYEAIDDRLSEDSATAVLRAPYETVVQFSGKLKPVAEDLGPVLEPGTIDGEIIQIGGRDETISVYLRDKQEINICTTTRDKGRSLARFIFRATWIRANNHWKRIHFDIESWDELQEQSLESVIQKLRDVPTPNIDNFETSEEVILKRPGRQFVSTSLTGSAGVYFVAAPEWIFIVQQHLWNVPNPRSRL